MMKLKSKKGFTLAELLIVIAIIAIMVAIAIPVFNGQLDKAKAGTDLANLRSAYAVAQMEVLTNPDADDAAVLGAIRTALPGVEAQYGDKAKGFEVKTGADIPALIVNGVIQQDALMFGGNTIADLIDIAQ